MVTAIGVLDRDQWWARTDNIVVVDPVKHQVMWVPRGLPILCGRLDISGGSLINAAFNTGGFIPGMYPDMPSKFRAAHLNFKKALSEYGINVDYSFVIRRGASERLLVECDVTVPVETQRSFWYPLKPTLPIQRGRKRVVFTPPRERLTGERVHQWLGARIGGSDYDRVRRQQVFVKTLLRSKFDFGRILQYKDMLSYSDKRCFDEIRKVNADWQFFTFSPVKRFVVQVQKKGSIRHVVARAFK